MLQKIIQVGNSAAVTIPKEFFDQLKLRVGLPVIVDLDTEEKILKVNPQPKKIKKTTGTNLSPGLISWANKFIDGNRELFKELANR